MRLRIDVTRGCFAALTHIKLVYFIVPSHMKVYHVSLNGQKNKLLGNIIHINIGEQAVK